MILRLDQLKVGEEGKIMTIDTGEQDLYRKLLNLGFIPGSQVKVLQSSPAFLLQVGFTQIALDRKTCSFIQVMLVDTM